MTGIVVALAGVVLLACGYGMGRTRAVHLAERERDRAQTQALVAQHKMFLELVERQRQVCAAFRRLQPEGDE